MRDLQRRRPNTPTTYYYVHDHSIQAIERPVPRRQVRSEHSVWFYVAIITVPMLLVGAGGIMFWLGWMTR